MRPADRRHQVVDLAADRSLGSTRVVSWNEAVEMNDSVESDAFVIPVRQRFRLSRLATCSAAFEVSGTDTFTFVSSMPRPPALLDSVQAPDEMWVRRLPSRA